MTGATNAVVSVAIYLSVLSFVEYRLATGGHGPGGLLVGGLLVVLTIKALGILMVYMRLYLAPRTLRASVLAVALLTGYSVCMMVVPVVSGLPQIRRPDTGPVVPGRAEVGRLLTVKFRCVSCHTVPTVATLANGLCPDLTGVADRAGVREPDKSADAYLRESIVDPGAYVVRGYLPWMPALRPAMTRQEFEDLVAFLMTLHQQQPTHSGL